jgi:hypothetical protein
MINFRGAAARMDPNGMATAAAQLGLTTELIQTVIDTETNGHGFDIKGRPSMLFEPHVFYRLLASSTATQNALQRAVQEGLAYRAQGMRPYPIDSYPHLKLAMMIDETNALQSASWGIGQIMGFNFKAAGYASVQDMVAAACASEDNQLEMMMRFIAQDETLGDALHQHDWETFAAHYNGSRNVAVYARKLASAYAANTTQV